jgi:hypothetical protein
VVEAPGGLVLPGFVDAHVHPVQAGLTLLRVALDDLPGRDAYLAAVGDYARTHPEEEWIVGGGWAMEHFPGGSPRREDLDRLTGDRPAFLFNRDVHGAWVNSAALRRGGITRDTPDPPDGRIERDADGEPTGTLHEGAAYTFRDRVVPAPTPDDLVAAALAAQAHLHSVGVTSWQDAWVTPEYQATYEALAADGRLLSRVAGALWWDRHRGTEQIDDLVSRRAQARGVRTVPRVPGFHGETVKIMVDGVIENGTGALLEPYLAPHGHDGHGGGYGTGLMYVSPDLLTEAVVRLDALGFQVHFHTIGDRAVRSALDAVEAAALANGAAAVAARRHHLAHIQVVQPADVPRFGALGVTANCQPFWAKHEPQMDDLTVPVLGPERSELQYPFESIRRAGGRLAFGSDWPVTTAAPLPQLEVAVTRVPHDDRSLSSLHPRERLRLDAAVDAFTEGSADACHDAAGGRLAVGARADLVVLDTDLFTDPSLRPADATVTHTVVGGAVVHEAAGP